MQTTTVEGKTYTLTVKEFAERMQLSLPTAYALTEQAGFPLLRVGKKKLTPIDALRRWLEEQANNGRAV